MYEELRETLPSKDLLTDMLHNAREGSTAIVGMLAACNEAVSIS